MLNFINDVGDTNVYVVFSNTIQTDLSSLITYMQTFLKQNNPLVRTGSDGKSGSSYAQTSGVVETKVYKMKTNDTYYTSEDYKYVLIVRKSLTGGAILFKIQNIIDTYGKDVDVHITDNITDTAVHDAYYDGRNIYTDSMVPLGTAMTKKLLYIMPPSYTITANVAGSIIPTDYTLGDIISGPKFAYADPDTPLALDDGPPYIEIKHGGMSRWSIILLVLFVLLVLIVAVAGGYKYYKKKKGMSG
jgi:hypothetical protein